MLVNVCTCWAKPMVITTGTFDKPYGGRPPLPRKKQVPNTDPKVIPKWSPSDPKRIPRLSKTSLSGFLDQAS